MKCLQPNESDTLSLEIPDLLVTSQAATGRAIAAVDQGDSIRAGKFVGMVGKSAGGSTWAATEKALVEAIFISRCWTTSRCCMWRYYFGARND